MRGFPSPRSRWGGVRGGGRRRFQSLVDRLQNTIDIFQNLIIPEAQHAIALRVEIRVTRCISGQMRCLIMLPAVDLNDEPCLVASKICEIRSDRCLATEMRLRQGQPFQVTPKFLFGVRNFAAKSPGAWHAHIARSCLLHPPTPDPSPPSGGGANNGTRMPTINIIRPPRRLQSRAMPRRKLSPAPAPAGCNFAAR